MRASGFTVRYVLSLVARYALALIFLVSAIGKLSSSIDFHSFVRTVPWGSGFDPGALLFAVVIVELSVVFLLVIPRTYKVGAAAAFVVLLSFTAVLMYASHTGFEQPCGCFGGFLEGESHAASILRNVFFMVLSSLSVLDTHMVTTTGLHHE
jgi:uncharacterized membrane protein YphA (DoxX/SURF4 family)